MAVVRNEDDGSSGGPFELGNSAAYARWRQLKLAGFPKTAAELVVKVRDPAALADHERDALMTRIGKTNMAVYQGPPPDGDLKDRVRRIDAQFGLVHLDANLGADDDGITSLQVVADGERSRYIPYTNRSINWHTDGYYNTARRRLRAMTLHCIRPAAEGGDNALFDHEVAYILLRDKNPEWIRALSHPRAMTIPANDESGREIRAAQTGPVFSLNNDGTLHMRYTARPRNVEWRDDPVTGEAVAYLKTLFGGNTPFIFRLRMVPGMGLITNNVLHNRTGFKDSAGAGRLVYRARYYDRVT